MARSIVIYLALLFVLIGWLVGDVGGVGIAPRAGWDLPEILLPNGEDQEKSEGNAGLSILGTRWALLVAGSNGYDNYRHQADVCHAYQILKKGGLKDENIVVFMYDDIAMHEFNPRKGTIINHPNGTDVYNGVPKDYTGKDVTTENLYGVLLGDKSKVKGGSGKVIDSKPNDRIFIYYTDHGGAGTLGMPNLPWLYANDFIHVLKKKHQARGYKEMVIYVESCESGSIFEGIMPEDLNIYVMTAANAEEDSYATYCPGMDPPPPPEFNTCLGDLYSVAWMEDSETHNLQKETIRDQHRTVKKRTVINKGGPGGSHVMQYGSKSINDEKLYLYQGFDPNSADFAPNNTPDFFSPTGVVNQRDAHLHFLWQLYKNTRDHGKGKEVMKEITATMSHRIHIDGSIEMIGAILFGPQNGSNVLNAVRGPGLPVVDDWGCLKSMVRRFETQCGSLTQYGMKHMRVFANICNNGVSEDAMEDACRNACYGREIIGHWHPANIGYSA